MERDSFASRSDQIDNPADVVWTDMNPSQNFFVLVEDVFRHKPVEGVPLGPSMENVCA